MHNLGPNVLVVPHTIGTLSFNEKPSVREANKAQAIKVAREYANMRAGMLVHATYGSIDQAIDSLSDAERQLIRELSEAEVSHRIEQGLAAGQQAVVQAEKELGDAPAADKEAAQQRYEAAKSRLETLTANAEYKRAFYTRLRASKSP